MEGEAQRRAGIFIGPEFGTVSRVDLVAAAREATEARFDVLIACAFNYDAHASELTKLGPLPILKARMNPDLHMADELKNTGKGNLFVVFGEPDIDVKTEKDGQLRVQVKGVDVFDPNTGDIRSNDTDAIAAWFIDTDYNEESFFVRHAYFLGAQRPLQEPEDDAQGRDRRGGLGNPVPRHLAPVPTAVNRADRGEGHQSLRGRGDEGVYPMRKVRPARARVGRNAGR